MTDEPDITAAGAFCVPMTMLYDVIASEPSIHFPQVTVSRGCFTWEDQRTDAERAADDAVRSLITREVGDILRAQNDVLDVACWYALIDGYDLHVQRHYSTRFIGIELAPRTSGRTFPTIYEHPDDWRWENLEDDGWSEP